MTAVMVHSADSIVETAPVEAEGVAVNRRYARAVPLAGLLIVLALWLGSLPRIAISRIGDYGLIPLLPLTFWLALTLLLLSFSLLTRRGTTATPLVIGHIVTLIVILHATPLLVYGTLRSPWAWRHLGIVDFFLRHDGIDTSMPILPAYQYWPAFFNANAMLDQASGVQTSQTLAALVPPVYNALLIGPLFLIFRTFTNDRRLVWSAAVIFFLGSWVGQDYFAPQACVYFLYLTVIALVLRYFGRQTAVRSQRRSWIAGLAITPMLAAIIPTHQLTPVMVVCALGMLAVFCRQRVWLLTLLMIGLTLGWDLIFAGQFFAANTTGLMSSFGSVGSNVSHASEFVNLAPPTHSQTVIAHLDKFHSASLWALALVGLIRRFRAGQFRGRSELALPLLAVAPVLLILTNDYGGEMIFRSYLFGLPFVAFYAAAAFFPRGTGGNSSRTGKRRWRTHMAPLALSIVLLLLVPGFVAGYYGREQTNYLSPDEVAATEFLLGVAPRGSLIVGTMTGLPAVSINVEFYDYVSFATYEPQDRQVILKDPVEILSDIMSPTRHQHAFLVISRIDIGAVESTGALPPGALAGIVARLSSSPKFKVIYRNPDAVIITLAQPVPEGAT